MTGTYGITPVYANLQLATLNNAGLSVPIVCAQLHNGDPGIDGTSSVSTVGARQQVTLDDPVGGATNLVGTSPSYNISGPDSIEALSLWSGFESDTDAYALYTLAAEPPVDVAEGDVLILNECSIAFASQGLAS